jgi:signal transduction histidine kinase
VDSGQGGRLPDLGPELAARLHDIAAGLAVGVSLLKGGGGTARAQRDSGVEVLESVLADVKQLARKPQRANNRSRYVDLATGLREEAARLGVRLELELDGEVDWLTAQEGELVRLAAREAIRNVRRHSGTAKCRITIDLSDCPFVLRARDWGAGIDPASQVGTGIERLRELASSLGCALAIGSQPGLGTVLVLSGRRCPCTQKTRPVGELDDHQLRSVVAEESLSSRRRVATRRPIRAPGQQIS